MSELHYRITHAGHDWTPFIKAFGESRGWANRFARDFAGFLERFRDEGFAAEPRSPNAPNYFFMAYRTLAALTPEERERISDWPSLRQLIDAHYFAPGRKRHKPTGHKKTLWNRRNRRRQKRKNRERAQGSRNNHQRERATVPGGPLAKFRNRKAKETT
jgi:hypothetical protein